MTSTSSSAEYPTSAFRLPFGAEDTNRNIKSEFTRDNSIPAKSGGSPITRHDLNGLGYIATIGSFLAQAGVVPKWASTIMYPKGARICAIRGDNYQEWVSMIDGNRGRMPWDEEESSGRYTYKGFPTDVLHEGLEGTVNNGVYVDSEGHVNGAWRPLYNLHNYNFFPSLSTKRLVYSETHTEDFEIPIDIEEGGWILIKRKIQEFDWEEVAHRAARTPGIGQINLKSRKTLSVSDGAYEEMDFLSMYWYEGEIATRMIPCSESLGLSGFKIADLGTPISVEIYSFPLEASE